MSHFIWDDPFIVVGGISIPKHKNAFCTIVYRMNPAKGILQRRVMANTTNGSIDDITDFRHFVRVFVVFDLAPLDGQGSTWQDESFVDLLHCVPSPFHLSGGKNHNVVSVLAQITRCAFQKRLIDHMACTWKDFEGHSKRPPLLISHLSEGSEPVHSSFFTPFAL